MSSIASGPNLLEAPAGDVAASPRAPDPSTPRDQHVSSVSGAVRHHWFVFDRWLTTAAQDEFVLA